MRCLLVGFAKPNTAKTLLEAQRDSLEALRVKNSSDPLYGFCEHLITLTEATAMYMGNNRIMANPSLYLYHAYLAYLEAYGHQRPLIISSQYLKRRFLQGHPAVCLSFATCETPLTSGDASPETAIMLLIALAML